MDRWHTMRVFVKVAETGSFADAGRQLHMSPPAVTRAISTLEESIGVRLLTRTTRTVKMTEAGSRYFEDCRRILSDIAEAEASAAGSYANPSGTLTVTGSTMFGQTYVLPILLEYLDRYPLVTGRSLFVDRFVNIIEGGIDVAIRIGHLPDSGHSAVKVGSIKRVICGAPSYFEKYGVPQSPADLANHRIISTTAAWVSLEWRFGRERQTVVTVHPRLLCNTN
jgi:DNA-binding transcriptional LysR family regulator